MDVSYSWMMARLVGWRLERNITLVMVVGASYDCYYCLPCLAQREKKCRRTRLQDQRCLNVKSEIQKNGIASESDIVIRRLQRLQGVGHDQKHESKKRVGVHPLLRVFVKTLETPIRTDQKWM